MQAKQHKLHEIQNRVTTSIAIVARVRGGERGSSGDGGGARGVRWRGSRRLVAHAARRLSLFRFRGSAVVNLASSSRARRDAIWAISRRR